MTENRRAYVDLATAFNSKAPPPQAPQDDTAYVWHDTIVADPYRPLEYPDHPPTIDWVNKENQRTELFLSGVAERQKIKDELTRIWSYPEDGLPGHYGARYFSFFQDGLAPQPIYQVRNSLDEPARTLIDPNAIAPDGTLALSGAFPSPDGNLVVYFTQVNGEDDQVLHVRDAVTGQDLHDTISGLRFSGAWWDRDNSGGFQYKALAADGSKRIIVKHHRIGTSPAEDTVFFDANVQGANPSSYNLPDGTLDWVSQTIDGSAYNSLWVRTMGTGEPFKKIFDAAAVLDPIAEVDGRVYMYTTHQAPLGKVVAVDLARPESENWQTILPEHPTDRLADSLFVQQGRLFANYRHGNTDQLRTFDLNGNHLRDVPIPPNSTFTLGYIDLRDKELLIKIAGFQQPGADYKYDIESGALTPWRPSTAVETLEGCVVETIEATSEDGTKIPMSVVRDPNTRLDGSAAVELFGYGAASTSLQPAYGPGIVQFVRGGGIFVQAYLRGGGEFGSKWYDQGRLHHKQNTFNDFAACAQELISRNYTSPDRLIALGASSGGLMVLTTREQHPELFGAVIAAVPVADLLRFAKYSNGLFWEQDFGNPEDSVIDFCYARAISPLHTVPLNGELPPLLVSTGDHDQRVVPGAHAYKYVATEQAVAGQSTLTLLRTDTNTGHGAGKPTEKAIAEAADMLAFSVAAIGPLNQDQYKLWRSLKPAVAMPKPK